MGVCGLWCFIVGYARVRNDLDGPERQLIIQDGEMFPVYVFRILSGGCFAGCNVGIPDGIAVLAGLAVQETQLLEGLAENVFAGHLVLGVLGCARGDLD